MLFIIEVFVKSRLSDDDRLINADRDPASATKANGNASPRLTTTMAKCLSECDFMICLIKFEKLINWVPFVYLTGADHDLSGSSWNWILVILTVRVDSFQDTSGVAALEDSRLEVVGRLDRRYRDRNQSDLPISQFITGEGERALQDD